MALITGLTSALSGMHAAQTQISLVSNNLANVDTEGYTRKTVQQLSNVVAGFGVGVKLANADRKVDQSLLRSYLTANSLDGNLDRTYDYLSKMDNLIGSPSDGNSIATDVANMQSSFETLATDVTSSANRYSLVSDAASLASRLNTLSKEIQSLRGDADLQIQEICNTINTKLDTISNLNNQIVKYRALGYDGAADLEDQRDEALKSISNYIDISYYTRDNGEIVIQTTGGVSLLDREAHRLDHSAVARAATDISYANGNINGIMVDGVDITNTVKNGQIKGLIDVRDNILPSMQTQLDELAGVMKDALNDIHNQGVSYPGVVIGYEGTRSFINPNVQTVSISGGDVRFSIFDTAGEQVATASLLGDLKFNHTNRTVSDLVQIMHNWVHQNLPNASVSLNENGRVSIDVGDSSYYLTIMDTQTSTIGSAQTSVTVSLDNNQDHVADRNFSGFSSFLGINDLFVTSTKDYIYESNVMGANSNLGIKSPITLNIATTTLNTELVLSAGDTLQSIVNKINDDDVLKTEIKASLVPNGNGYMLQLVNSSGEQMEISEKAQVLPSGETGITGFLSRIGLGVSHCNTASNIQVREDIRVNPNLLSVGSPEFNVNTGKYNLNDGNNNVANKMAKVFADEQTFGQSGSLSKVTTTLADYASTFVGNIASRTNAASTDKEYQDGLVSSLANKQALNSGVDSDEELANLIVYQQSYAACAQVWSATRELVDILFNAL